ncbi:putative ubiquitin protein ligase [Emiliania huxleyi CCMP1516]|uniref:HECT-type E3 ubiquitin transferase n=2 Tax=Emiliania huxleyi TaxID=2903 RepID=A0A0D3I3R7_EMIH1|nr:putative ubiquitin protein ligase [Emiliania huxleyi CCMP1516]EOD05902.1 putative ubiquitin protein ligase [Emiliania huxleyi CCMP1516]|eukprot:XP_005758331.1 putative ubiquitin protein ligase [Emiliania huxleyi CCMP1516]
MRAPSFRSATTIAASVGDFEGRAAPTRLASLSATPMRSVAAGERHAVAVSIAGDVYAWGSRRHGALGLPLLAGSEARGLPTPRAVPALRGRRAVAAASGSDWAMALLEDGSVYCWGKGVQPRGGGGGARGEGGGEPPSPRRRALSAEALSSAAGAAPSGTATPQLLELPASCTAVAAGRSHGLALCGGGDAAVYSWGVGDYGQLGAGAALERPHAERLPLPLGIAPRCVAAGGYGSAAAGELGPPQPPALSAGSALCLADGRRWGELAERVGAVFASPALLAACFGAADGSYDPAALEATYVTLMRTYEAAPPVVAALRASIPRLLSHLGGEIEAAQGAQTVALLALLRNRAPAMLASLSPPASRRAAELLSAAPNEVLGGRVVRPLRELLERLFCRGGSLAALTERVAPVVGTLSLARDASALAAARGLPAVPAAEFRCAALSERLCAVPTQQLPNGTHQQTGPSGLQRDYAAWAQGEAGFTFCSQPWLFSVAAKGKLLQLEAALRMQHSQQVALRHSLFGPQPRLGIGAKRGALAWLPADVAAADAAAPFLVLRVRRASLVEDALESLAGNTPLSLLKPLRVVFVGEEGIDEGGLRKELFQLLIEALFTGGYGLFVWNEEVRCFWFSRDSLAQEGAADYLLVGLVVGLAIHNGTVPTLLFSQVLGEPSASLESLKQVDPELARGLAQLLEFDGDVEVTFMATFTVAATACGEPKTVELLPGGADRPVTNESREEYVRLVVEHILLTGVRPAFDAFRRGLLTLCDGPALSFLSPEELEELVCGTPHLDFAALQARPARPLAPSPPPGLPPAARAWVQANTRYDGFRETDVTVKHFWEVVHAYSTDEKRALLAFATGCDRAPVGGLGKLKLILQKSGPDSMALPHSHTCFNLLAMPAYTSRGKMRDRLGIAIHNAKGFGLQ